MNNYWISSRPQVCACVCMCGFFFFFLRGIYFSFAATVLPHKAKQVAQRVRQDYTFAMKQQRQRKRSQKSFMSDLQRQRNVSRSEIWIRIYFIPSQLFFLEGNSLWISWAWKDFTPSLYSFCSNCRGVVSILDDALCAHISTLANFWVCN